MRLLFQSFSFIEKNGYYNISTLLLASALKTRPELAESVDVKVIQSDYFADLDEVMREITEFEPDIVAFSVYIWSIDLTEELVRRCAELPNRPTTLFGGKGLNGWSEDFLAANPGADVVVNHDGELTFLELMSRWVGNPDRLRRLEDIEGITFRDEDDRIQRNRDRRERMMLRDIPSPYLAGLFRPRHSFMMETERYCPNYCSYCTWRKFNKKAQDNQQDMAYIRSDLEWAIKNGYRDIRVWDAAVNYDTERFVEMLDVFEELDDDNNPCEFSILTNDKWIDDRQLQRILEFKNTLHVNLSLESFSEEALHHCNRPNTIESIKQLAQTISTRSVSKNNLILCNFMLGLPGDTVETFFGVLDFFKKIPRVHITVSPLVVAPGTVFKQKEKRFGFEYQPGVPFVKSNNSFTEEDMQRGFEKVQQVADEYHNTTVNPLFVPFNRILNPEIVPAARRASLEADSKIWVGVAGIQNGHVLAANVYPEIALAY